MDMKTSNLMIDDIFEFNDNCTRGYLFKRVKPRFEKTLRLNSFPIRCINKWDTLSEDIVCSDTVFKFITGLNKVLWPERYILKRQC